MSVRPVDPELLVGTGQEEIEPGGRRDRGDVSGQPVTEGCDGDDHEDHRERRIGVGEVRAERDQDCGQDQRSGEAHGHRDAVEGGCVFTRKSHGHLQLAADTRSRRHSRQHSYWSG